MKDAKILVLDLQGKQLQTILDMERGLTSVIISGNPLSADMYVYALIVDGKLITSKTDDLDEIKIVCITLCIKNENGDLFVLEKRSLRVIASLFLARLMHFISPQLYFLFRIA